MSSVVSGVDFNVNSDYVYTKAKVNSNGRKSVGILNAHNKKSLHMGTPLMLTWGVNTFTDEKTGSTTYDLALQFPIDEYNNPDCVAFLKNMQALEQKIKDDAVSNSKDWLNKAKLVPEAVDALWSPMLKYPKDKDTGEPDYSRPPTLKVKIPYWDGEFKNVELYDHNKDQLYPNDNEMGPGEFITKGSNIATLIQCGGIWIANGKFGVTWKLFQAVVKPRESLKGKCHINLSDREKEKMETVTSETEENAEEECIQKPTQVEDSDDEEEVKQEVKQEIESKMVTTEDVPKKKRIIKKKTLAT